MASWNPALRPNSGSRPDTTETTSNAPADVDASTGTETVEEVAELSWDTQDAETGQDEPEDEFFVRHGGHLSYDAKANPKANPLISRATGLDMAVEEDTEEAPETPIDPPENTSTSGLINAPPVTETSAGEDTAMEEHPAEQNYEPQSESTFLEDAKQENPADPLVPETDAALNWGSSDASFDIGADIGPVSSSQPEEMATEKTVDWGEIEDDFDLGVKDASAMATNSANGPALQSKPADLDWGPGDDGDLIFEATGTQAAEIPPASAQQDELDDLWKAALDDDFGTTADSSAFLFDDDEGFLEEEAAQLSEQVGSNGTNGAIGGSLSNSKYAPVGAQAVQPPSNQYTPQAGRFADVPQSNSSNTAQIMSTPAYGGINGKASYGKPERPAITNSAQSFADKNKGGYASPYDLPTDIIQPKKRVGSNRMAVPSAQPTPPPPPRSSSMNSTASMPPPRSVPQTYQSSTTFSPPSSSSSMNPEIRGQLRPKASTSSFFEELPSVAKPKSSGRYTPQPSAVHHAPSRSPIASQPLQPPSNPQPSVSEPPTDPVAFASHLQQPERLSLFSESPPSSNLAPAPTITAKRYSPAPPSTGPAASRYSPAPPAVAPSQISASAPPPKYSPPSTVAVPTGLNQNRYAAEPTAQPRSSSQSFLPRTSSPLAHHTMSQGGAGRSSSQAPPTSYQPSRATASPPATTDMASSNTGSPRKTSNYAPQPQNSQAPLQQSFAPPRRSQTSSPGTVMKSPPYAAHADRPSSHHGPGSPPSTISGESIFPSMPPRLGYSQDTVFAVPTDERAQDPLERWKGYPVFRWGLGGTVVTSFPQQTPRYGAGNTAPTMKRSPGEIKLQSIKQTSPLDDKITTFPGPLKGKGKKKDVVVWMKAQIETMGKDYQSTAIHGTTTEDLRRRDERLLLWKILQVFIENDGKLEGSKVAEDSVKQILQVNVETSTQLQPGEKVQSEPVDPQAVTVLRDHLSTGDREKATWHAVDNRLWGHAMLISSTLSKDVWKQVIQEFVRQEVRKISGDNQALAALYEVFAGNWEDSVDQLVPVSARAGFQMINTTGPAINKNALEGLDKWQETLLLILGNRSEGDAQALLSLARLLAGYRRTDAAHICALFARSMAHFGGTDDPQADIVLFGADHRNANDIAQDLDAIILTEVYEYGLSLSSTTASLPHLQPYKLVHAYALAEYGQRSNSISYCDHIAAVVKSSTRGSPYYNATFLSHLDDLTKRLSQAPKDGSSSWISKPSMEKVSGSFLAKFNSFVAGDDSDAASNQSGGADVGPFARIAGNTPTISPTQSSADLYGQYRGNGSVTSPAPGFSPQAPSSRYAPGAVYTPQQSFEQPHSQYMPQEASSYTSSSAPNPYAPSYNPTPNTSQAPTSQPSKSHTEYNPPVQEPSNGYSPYGTSSYQSNVPPDSHNAATEETVPVTFDQAITSHSQPTNSVPSAYEPPSMGSYEPPSYQPYEPEPELEQETSTEKKKKSFMDDDDDDQMLKQAEALKKQQRAQADKEAEENFKRAAEADAAKSKGQDGGKGWFGGWFKKDPNAGPGPIKAKLGEESSFVYDTELKKWVNKKGGSAAATPSAPTPPPPRGPPSRAPSGAGPPISSGPPTRPPTSMPMGGPPSGPPSRVGTPASTASVDGGASAPPLLPPHLSNGPPSGPPSRPNTSMSNASSIDDLLGAPQARKGGTVKKGKRGGRYVDVMAAK
ncbi:hypothetical protein EJ05DRAFT_540331 [Pseudovirgaria hyperparasitica]|uniref:Protein transport protein sec16 n=1 Tax=Pseudovirgaria hyperparasitica TaxID=470096 RepID=A0A6A6W3N4_9PEZI|nr:uncharacterized protein EJ05DRAFT_540331 [Pseudovirgaria hyperparasitica]KAF2755651.1 hypothetical protein EJ05DRAFT_540331 [Pseudovirgaria hyperparasitica]